MSYIRLLLAVAAVVLLISTFRRKKINLPPGPPRYPLLGNALQLPNEYLYRKFIEWSKIYGDVFSIQAMDQIMVVLSSPEAVKEVLDKQGSHTGSRLNSGMVALVIEPSNIIVSDLESNACRVGRRTMHNILSTSTLDQFLKNQTFESTWLLKDVLHSPQDLYTHIRRTTASSMMAIISGRHCLQYAGTTVEKYYTALQGANVLISPETYPLVNAFPMLNLIPEILAPWKRKARYIRELRAEMHEAWLSPCEKAIGTDKETGCFFETVLKENKILTRDEIANMGGIMMDGGTKSSASVIQSCILAAINYPECQQKVQAEMDNVVGRDRLPVWEDVKNLPYLQAFVNEVLRFRPVLPLALPHLATKDVLYKGYTIPKGTILFMNSYGILNDENSFEQPELFNPDRYLESQFGTKSGADDSCFRNNFVFGAGRRICPGENLARRTVTINVMRLLWAFNFSKDNSGTGGMDPIAAYASAVETGPLPFTCDVKPRDERCVDAMNTTFRNLKISSEMIMSS